MQRATSSVDLQHLAALWALRRFTAWLWLSERSLDVSRWLGRRVDAAKERALQRLRAGGRA